MNQQHNTEHSEEVQKHLAHFQKLEENVKKLEGKSDAFLRISPTMEQARSQIKSAPDPVENIAKRFSNKQKSCLRISEVGLWAEDYISYVGPLVAQLREKITTFNALRAQRREYEDLLQSAKKSCLTIPTENPYTEALTKHLNALNKNVEDLTPQPEPPGTTSAYSNPATQKHHLIQEKDDLQAQLNDLKTLKGDKNYREGTISGCKYIIIAIALFGIDGVANYFLSYGNLSNKFSGAVFYAFLIALFIGTSAHSFGMCAKGYPYRIPLALTGSFLLLAALLAMFVPRLTGASDPDLIQAWQAIVDLFTQNDTSTEQTNSDIERQIAADRASEYAISSFSLVMFTLVNITLFTAGIINSLLYHGSHPALIKQPLLGKALPDQLKAVESEIESRRNTIIKAMADSQLQLNEASHASYSAQKTLDRVQTSLTSIKTALDNFKIEQLAHRFAKLLNDELHLNSSDRYEMLFNNLGNDPYTGFDATHIAQICKIEVSAPQNGNEPIVMGLWNENDITSLRIELGTPIPDNLKIQVTAEHFMHLMTPGISTEQVIGLLKNQALYPSQTEEEC